MLFKKIQFTHNIFWREYLKANTESTISINLSSLQELKEERFWEVQLPDLATKQLNSCVSFSPPSDSWLCLASSLRTELLSSTASSSTIMTDNNVQKVSSHYLFKSTVTLFTFCMLLRKFKLCLVEKEW